MKKNISIFDVSEDKNIDLQTKKRITDFYKIRFRILRKGRRFFQKNEIKKAVDNYLRYLNGLAMWKNTTEDRLSPDDFDKSQDIAELLLISHVYWDIAKAFDRSSDQSLEVHRCLKQFCKFTIGFKYQYANAQVVKKFMERSIVRNKDAFQMAHDKIRIKTKGCYIASCVLGTRHPVTVELRSFRDTVLVHSKVGLTFLKYYYVVSPKIVGFLLRYPLLGLPLNRWALRPILCSIIAPLLRYWRKKRGFL